MPQIEETCRAEFACAMETLAARLGDKEFVMGDAFTAPDLLPGHCAGSTGAARFDLPGGPVGACFARLRAQPARAAAMACAASALAA